MSGRGKALLQVAAGNFSALNNMPAQHSNYQFVNGKNRKVYKGTKAGVFYRKTPSGARAYLKEHEKKALLNHLLKHSVAPPAVVVNKAPNNAVAVPLGPNIKPNNKVNVPKSNKNFINLPTQKNNKGNYYVNAKNRKVYKGKTGALFRIRASGTRAYLTKLNKQSLLAHLTGPVNMSTPGFLPPSPSLSSFLGTTAKRTNANARAVSNMVARAVNKAKRNNSVLLAHLNTRPRFMGARRIVGSAPARF